MQVSPFDQLLTIDEVSRLLRVSRNTAYTMCRDGRLPAIKLGRDWRIRRADLEELLKQDFESAKSRPMPFGARGQLLLTRAGTKGEV